MSTTIAPRPILVVVARAILWIAWLCAVLLWVPRVESVFRRMNLRPGSSAQFVFDLTHGLIPLGLLLVLALIAVDVIVSYRLHRAVAKTLWSGLMTIVPIAAMLVTAITISRPMLLVLEAIIKTST